MASQYVDEVKNLYTVIDEAMEITKKIKAMVATEIGKASRR